MKRLESGTPSQRELQQRAAAEQKAARRKKRQEKKKPRQAREHLPPDDTPVAASENDMTKIPKEGFETTSPKETKADRAAQKRKARRAKKKKDAAAKRETTKLKKETNTAAHVVELGDQEKQESGDKQDKLLAARRQVQDRAAMRARSTRGTDPGPGMPPGMSRIDGGDLTREINRVAEGHIPTDAYEHHAPLGSADNPLPVDKPQMDRAGRPQIAVKEAPYIPVDEIVDPSTEGEQGDYDEPLDVSAYEGEQQVEPSDRYARMAERYGVHGGPEQSVPSNEEIARLNANQMQQREEGIPQFNDTQVQNEATADGGIAAGSVSQPISRGERQGMGRRKKSFHEEDGPLNRRVDPNVMPHAVRTSKEKRRWRDRWKDRWDKLMG